MHAGVSLGGSYGEREGGREGEMKEGYCQTMLRERGRERERVCVCVCVCVCVRERERERCESFNLTSL